MYNTFRTITATAILLTLIATVACTDGNDSDGAGGEQTTDTVTEEGGEVESADGNATLTFPEGAVSGEAEVTIERLSRPDRDDLLSDVYEFGIDAELQELVAVSIDLNDEPGGDKVVLARYVEGGDPVPVGDSVFLRGAVVGELDGFSAYGGFLAPGDEVKSETTLGEGGGVATSDDGNFRIEFPSGVFEGEATVTISNFTRDSDSNPDDNVDTDVYSVMVFDDSGLVEDLGTTATIEIDANPTADQKGRLVGSGRLLGLIPGSQLDGNTLVGEVTDLSDGPFRGAIFEFTDRCEDIDPFDDSCSDDGDCAVDPSSTFYECVCNDDEISVGFSCHGGGCESVLGSCAGIGLGHDGFCDEHGGWAGDCYFE